VGSRAASAAAAALCAFGLVGLDCATATPAAADNGATGVRIDSGDCSFNSNNIKGTPWAIQRLLTQQMWADTKGAGVKVAVIDTGVDNKNPQLRDAVDAGAGAVFLKGAEGGATHDEVGHGTKVAGIIAARPASGTGFVGIAPDATIIPIRQNDAEGHGQASGLADAIRHAVKAGAQVINISQDTAGGVDPGPDLKDAVDDALKNDVVVVAAAGNDGASGTHRETYPASYPGVLAVAASDRNNERATFSQPGSFVGVAAPGVDMVSTVPGRGQCVDSGTSFAAPYVAGVAALIVAKHEDWTPRQVVAQIEQTAERIDKGRNDNIGWGVVDPVAALSNDEEPIDAPHADNPSTELAGARNTVVPGTFTVGETEQERDTRFGIYAVGLGGLIIGVVIGSGIAVRDWRRKQGIITRRDALS
jgi:membrane-anchored mycosin MYCP